MNLRSVDLLIRDLGAWVFKGVRIDIGVCLCFLIAAAVLWYATRSTGENNYPQVPR